MLKPGDPVRVERCRGIARVVKYVRKYGVYLLDRPMSFCYPAPPDGAPAFVSYWTFEAKDLQKIEVS